MGDCIHGRVPLGICLCKLVPASTSLLWVVSWSSIQSKIFATPAARMQKMTSHESPSRIDLSAPAWTPRLMPGVSVVVPVYNSAATLPILVQRLEPALVALRIPFAVILVNDGSMDASWQVIEELAQKHGWVEGVCMMRNYGQHNALLAGLREARYETVVTMDDDLQHPPEEIHKLLAKLNDTYDVVYGTPEMKQHSLWRNVVSFTMRWTLRTAMGIQMAGDVSAFRALRTRLRDACERYHSPHVNLDVLLSWGTTRFASVDVRHDPRLHGTSTYSLGKLLSHALSMVTGFSTLPLRLASMAGFGFTLFGIGVLAYVLIRYYQEGGSLPGFPFLASVISIFSGAQLFALGVLGEYLARIHFRTMDRPVYAVRLTTAVRADK
jgi:glycosyltransferase involved in cell wall biosynthesis